VFTRQSRAEIDVQTDLQDMLKKLDDSKGDKFSPIYEHLLHMF